MKLETKIALEASIAHWEEVLQRRFPWTFEIGAGECALCQMFIIPTASCSGCPIHEKTGFEICDKTPYPKAHRMLEAWGGAMTGSKKQITKARLDFQEVANEELEFLKGLRDE